MWEKLLKPEKLVNTVAWKPLGLSLLDYHEGKVTAALLVKCSVEKDRYVNLNNFYRDELLFNGLETQALKQCRGRILDVGAGSGAHSLYLQKRKLEVTAIDISEEAVKVMKERGVKNAFSFDFFSFPAPSPDSEGGFDTLLFMMNGIGIGGTLPELRKLLRHARLFLNPGGQILFDSTDLDYITSENRLGASLRYPRPEYYGTVYYQLRYGAYLGEPYKWGFYDQETLQRVAAQEGYSFEILAEEEEHYAGRIRPIDGNN